MSKKIIDLDDKRNDKVMEFYDERDQFYGNDDDDLFDDFEDSIDAMIEKGLPYDSNNMDEQSFNNMIEELEFIKNKCGITEIIDDVKEYRDKWIKFNEETKLFIDRIENRSFDILNKED